MIPTVTKIDINTLVYIYFTMCKLFSKKYWIHYMTKVSLHFYSLRNF
jgi:hypothetical protein